MQFKELYLATCSVCSEQAEHKVRYRESRKIIKCGRCSYVSYESMPSLQEVESVYHTYAYRELIEINPITLQSFSEVLALLGNQMGNIQMKILDFGCGQGDFLKFANDHNIEAQGIEFSEAARNLCASRNLRCSLAKNIADSKSLANAMEAFNIIVGFEILEHLISPIEFFEFAQEILPPGGLVLLTTPNDQGLASLFYGWGNTLSYPEHVSAFSGRTLETLARRYGFLVLKRESRGIDGKLAVSLRNWFGERVQEKRTQLEVNQSADVGDWSMNEPKSNRKILYLRSLVNRVLRFTRTGSSLRFLLRKA